MKNLYQVLKALEAASGSKEKITILVENDTEKLRAFLKSACDPFITYGVKSYTFSEQALDHSDFEYNFKYIDFLITGLHRRTFTGKAAQDAIIKASKSLNEQQQYVLARILDKDLKCGVSVATINQAFPGLIPVWKMQKANKVDYAKITYPCWAEIKENGRGNTAIVLGDEVKHYSNEGNENQNMSVFNEELISIASGIPVVFFGEVRGRHGTGVEQFKDSQSLGAHNADMTNQVFVVWDMLMLGEFKKQECNRPQEIRTTRLRDMVNTYRINHDKDEYKVQMVAGKRIESEDELNAYASKMMAKGKEGLIVKRLDAPYLFKRNDNWMKIKESHTLDLKVVDVKEGKGVLAGTLGSVTVLHGKVKVDCPMGKGVTREVALALWEKYKEDKKNIIGQIAEVTFQNETPDGSLFLPKFLRLRTGEKSKADKPSKKK